MNKKIERLITIGMIAGLVGYFCYRVAYGEAQFGFSKGKIRVPGGAYLGFDAPLCPMNSDGTAVNNV